MTGHLSSECEYWIEQSFPQLLRKVCDCTDPVKVGMLLTILNQGIEGSVAYYFSLNLEVNPLNLQTSHTITFLLICL